ncbi:MAG: hypothetical protein JWR69_1806 [Pedosphaera sp.]|nr:hypothetical protein [Pedosphaera sp.]
MRTKRTVVVLAASLVLLVLLAVIAVKMLSPLGGPMPVYQGKTAREWLNQSPTNQAAAVTAFQEMGPAALPVLVHVFQKGDPSWARFYRRAYPKIPRILRDQLPLAPSPLKLWASADIILTHQPDAKTVLPDLRRIWQDTNNPSRPILTGVILALGGKLGPDTAPATDKDLQAQAKKRPQPKITDPRLDAVRDDSLVDFRLRTAWAFWKSGHKTNEAVALFREFVKSKPAPTCDWAAIYLSEAQPEDVSLIPFLVEAVHSSDPRTRSAATMELAKYGPAARPASHAVQEFMQAGDVESRKLCLKTLGAIDPEAAAKYPGTSRIGER